MTGCLKISDPHSKALDPVQEVVQTLLWSVKVEVRDAICEVVDYAVTAPVSCVEFEELFINEAHGFEAGEGIVTRLVFRPTLGEKCWSLMAVTSVCHALHSRWSSGRVMMRTA